MRIILGIGRRFPSLDSQSTVNGHTRQAIGSSWIPISFWDRYVPKLLTIKCAETLQMDLLAALPASIPLVLPSTTLAEVRHRSLPLYNRLQQLITEEDRHVWVFWNEQRRETATKVEYSAVGVDEDGEEEEEKPDVAGRERESVNDRNDRGELSLTRRKRQILTPAPSNPTYPPILRNPPHVPAPVARRSSPATCTPDRRPGKQAKGPGYGLVSDVDAGIRRWVAG